MESPSIVRLHVIDPPIVHLMMLYVCSALNTSISLNEVIR
jgi:hypothetical protein